MKLDKQLLALLLCALPVFSCSAQSWHWATAQCSDQGDENVYMFVALVQTETEGQQGTDDARFGFGNYAEANYAEERCGVAEITAQNMYATSGFDSQDEAAQSLDEYVQREEAKGNAWLKVVRVDDYIDE